MKTVVRIFAVVHSGIAAVFSLASLLLLGVAAQTLWRALRTVSHEPAEAASIVIESFGLLAVALVGLEIAQTVLEEEVVREAQISGPTRVRRYLSRFMVVVVVALAIESLVATFTLLHRAPESLPYAASLAYATAALLAGWGLFVWLNRAAEDVEPECMREAKAEDVKLK